MHVFRLTAPDAATMTSCAALLRALQFQADGTPIAGVWGYVVSADGLTAILVTDQTIAPPTLPAGATLTTLL